MIRFSYGAATPNAADSSIPTLIARSVMPDLGVASNIGNDLSPYHFLPQRH